MIAAALSDIRTRRGLDCYESVNSGVAKGKGFTTKGTEEGTRDTKEIRRQGSERNRQGEARRRHEIRSGLLTSTIRGDDGVFLASNIIEKIVRILSRRGGLWL